MVLVLVETVPEQQLLTDPVLHEAHRRIAPCLEVRNAVWHYSLLSDDRRRIICVLDAPDAESVREAYRKGGWTSSRVWAGQVIKPEGVQPEKNAALLKVIEGTYPPLSEEDWNESKNKTLPCYLERGIEWIQSYISLDRTRLICELNAPDAESVREAQRQVGIPFDRVWSAHLLKD